MAKVALLKLQYFGNMVRGSAGELALMAMEGAMEGTRPMGASRKQWLDNIPERSEQTYQEYYRRWHKISAGGERCHSGGRGTSSEDLHPKKTII
jgi:hypothetical protein